MNNEPIAYGKYIENAKMWLVVELDADIPKGYIPLYTHPAKTLTDEEIQEIAHGFEAIGWMGETTYEFARAILRKAQEK
jgi:hypothetical protein